MKKVFVVLLALALVLSLTGMALAGERHKKCCPSQANWSNIKQKVEIYNTAIASTGNVNATGNIGITDISGNTSSAHSCSGNATNNSGISVNNSGSAEAFSGAATVVNNNTNTVTQDVTVTESNTSNNTTTNCGDLQ